jgi:low affinity Fe/Cu permease
MPTHKPGAATNQFRFSVFARKLAVLTGRPSAFMVAVGLVVLWALTGRLFGYSDTWQLVINTSTTIVTFLMVFLIQNTQNRDTAAIQIKLDELIRATQGAHNALLDLEEIEDEQLLRYLKTYQQLAAVSRDKIAKGRLDTDSPDIKPLKKE